MLFTEFIVEICYGVLKKKILKSQCVFPIRLFSLRSSFVSVFVLGFTPHSRIFHSYGDVTIIRVKDFKF